MSIAEGVGRTLAEIAGGRSSTCRGCLVCGSPMQVRICLAAGAEILHWDMLMGFVHLERQEACEKRFGAAASMSIWS